MVATFKCTEGPSVLLVITQQGINFSKRRTGNFANMGKSPTNAGMAEMACGPLISYDIVNGL